MSENDKNHQYADLKKKAWKLELKIDVKNSEIN